MNPYPPMRWKNYDNLHVNIATIFKHIGVIGLDWAVLILLIAYPPNSFSSFTLQTR